MRSAGTVVRVTKGKRAVQERLNQTVVTEVDRVARTLIPDLKEQVHAQISSAEFRNKLSEELHKRMVKKYAEKLLDDDFDVTGEGLIKQAIQHYLLDELGKLMETAEFKIKVSKHLEESILEHLTNGTDDEDGVLSWLTERERKQMMVRAVRSMLK
jgi:hypothetical protein